MLKTVEGVYHQGRVDLLESPRNIVGDVPVIVTFLTDVDGIDLRDRGIDRSEAADLRGRLSVFSEDWQDLEMDVYDEQYARA